MDWEDVMERLYVHGGGEEEVIDEINDVCFKINEEIGDKRNKKQRFFEELLDREEGDGYLIINYIDTWKDRPNLGKDRENPDRENAALDLVMKEWQLQISDATTNDTLYHVLCKRNEHFVYRCSALLKLSRRIRRGHDAFNSNAAVAQKIIDRALQIEEDHRGVEDNGEWPSNYQPTPVKFIGLSLRFQRLYNLTRFGDMRKVIKESKDLKKAVLGFSELRDLDWRPDIRLEWWTWQSRLRAAAHCRDAVGWNRARKEMERLESKAPDGLSRYLIGARSKRYPTSKRTKPKVRNLRRIHDFLKSWHEFWKVNDNAQRMRQLKRAGKNDEESERLYDHIDDCFRKFSKGLRKFSQYIHSNSSEVAEPVKHSYATTKEEKERRASKILGEVSHAHQKAIFMDSQQTCFVLEILHRLLVYRLWWESINYNRHPKKEDIDDRCCFNIDHAKRILADIRVDLERLQGSRQSLGDIENSIAMVFSLNGKESDEITKTMRGHLEYLHDSGGDRYRRANKNGDWGPGHHNFLGLWYADLLDPELDSYKTPNPLMRPIGMWVDTQVESGSKRAKGAAGSFENPEDWELLTKLKKWRDDVAKKEKIKHFKIAWDDTLEDIAIKRPDGHAKLLECKGIGELKLGLYGDDILKIIRENRTGSG